MNNILEERKRLAIEATKRRLMEETIDDFISLSYMVESNSHTTEIEEIDRLTVELLNVVELKKISLMLVEINK